MCTEVLQKLKKKFEELKEKKKQMDPDVLYNAVWWVVSAVFSSILPLLVMLGNYIAYNCKGSLLDFYTGYTDTAVFLFAVTISLMLLCLDTNKRIDKNAKNGGLICSLLFMIMSVMVYAVRTKQKAIDDSELRQLLQNMSESKEMSKTPDFEHLLAMWDEPPILVHILTYLFIFGFICIGWNILTKHVYSEDDQNKKGEETSNENSEKK